MTLIIRVFIYVFCILSSAFTQNELLRISFNEMVEMANKNSISIQQLKEEQKQSEYQVKKELSWTNPALDYSREIVNNESEHSITLTKQIEFPWIYSLRKQRVKNQLESIQLRSIDKKNQFYAAIKSKYCTLKLTEKQMQQLQKIKDHLSEISKTAENQFREGNLSGVEKHLIEMALMNITAQHQNLASEWIQNRNDLKVKLGIDQTMELQLKTEIDFQLIQLKPVKTYVTMAAQSSRYRQMQLNQMTAKKGVQLVKSSLIPHFNIFGGKKMVDNSNGFIAGLSLPLPIFNLNQSKINQAQAEADLADYEFDQFKQNLNSQLNSIKENIEKIGKWLEKYDAELKENKQFTSNLISAYDEGWMSLTEFLNAIEIHVGSNELYYDQLSNYYEKIFNLEAITGEELITFKSEGDK